MARKLRKPSNKTVFVVESDPVRQAEIKDAMSHQEHWSFEFFNDAKECLDETAALKPLAVFLDLQHFDRTHDEKYGFQLIDRFKEKAPKTEVLVFSESDNEQWAAESLRHGARDYIIFSPHQYVKMEYELTWLEQVLDRQNEDQRFIRRLTWMFGVMAIFFLAIIVLYEMGILKEGQETRVLIGE
jgi:DNA-binding NarL/FixJ family response regulator